MPVYNAGISFLKCHSTSWYSQNVWNNTYGPTIHLFPIRLLRKNFWCYKMKKEGNLIIMLTDFSAMLCYVLRGDIFASTLDVSSLNFCDMGFFFNYVWYLCHLMTFVSSFAKSWRFILRSHLHVIRKKSREGEEILLMKIILNVKQYLYFNLWELGFILDMQHIN